VTGDLSRTTPQFAVRETTLSRVASRSSQAKTAS
jgi:hypothetical protein